MISGKIISLYKRNKNNYTNEINGLKSIQDDIVNFKNVLILIILYQLFDDCKMITPNSKLITEKPLENLWRYIQKIDFDENETITVSYEEAQVIKDYFQTNKETFENCIDKLQSLWIEILKHYNQIKAD